MIADQMQKGIAADKRPGLIDRVGIAKRLRLFDELKTANVVAGCGPVGVAISGTYDNSDLFDACRRRLFDYQLQGSLVLAVSINQLLKREPILVWRSGSDDGLTDLHGGIARGK